MITMIGTQVIVVKEAFGNSRIVAQIGNTILSHVMLFKPAHKARAEAQAAKIQALLLSSTNPVAELSPELWEDASQGRVLKKRVFKPREAVAA